MLLKKKSRFAELFISSFLYLYYTRYQKKLNPFWIFG